MEKKRIVVPVAVSAVAGALAGLLAPGVSEGLVYNFSAKIHAGGNGATETLTTGWHDAGSRALDWGNANYDPVKFRSQGWCSRSCTRLGWTQVSQNNTTSCKRVKVTIKAAIPSGVTQGSMYYTHTTAQNPSGSGSYDGSSFNVKGGTSSSYPESQWTRAQIGWTVKKYVHPEVPSPTPEIGEDLPGCPTDGGHVHEYDSGGSKWILNNPGSAQNDPFPDGGSPYIPYPVEQPAYYQTMLSWSYQDVTPTKTPTPSK